MNRRLFIFSSVAVLLSSTTGCLVTHQLYDTINEPKYQNYTETVNQILFSADGKKLVFIGPEYHYIFDVPEHLEALLNSPLHKKMTAEIVAFSVNRDAKVTGRVYLNIEKPNDDEKSQVMALGFLDSHDGHSLYCFFDLQGTRYSAKGFNMPASTMRLNQSYAVNVREQLPIGVKKALVLLTPLTVAADGAIVLLAIPLIIFGGPYILYATTQIRL